MITTATLASQIIAQYRASKKREYDNEYMFFPLYRWCSFYPTALCIKAGLTANQVTAIGCVVLLIACFTLYAGWLLTGALLYTLAYVLDFVDGNIARFTESFSAFGKMVDGLVDSLTFLIFLGLAHGLTVSGNGALEPSVEVSVGVAGAFFFLFRSYVQIRLTFVRGSIDAAAQLGATSAGRSDWFKLAKRALFALVSGMPMLLVLSVLLGHGSIFNIFYMLFFGILTIVEIIYGLRILYER